ncbi:hypothetical protein K439DRAFT_991285 [Ramaria rubella]|nr:hypothetical protein K439DRAFT_991285 [Ramaria rubella]
MSFTVIYYGYNGSPFMAKLESILLLKKIPARRVDVASFPPRPELATLLGIPYRRIPVLALGRDIFVDTALIAIALEKRFSHPQHPSIFPPKKGADSGNKDIGVQKAFSRFYADRALFNLGFELLPWTRVPTAMQADRRKFMHRDLDFEKMKARWPLARSKLISHLDLTEEQLDNGQEWFLDTKTPGLTDISVHFALTWIRSFRHTRPLFDVTQYPRTVAWLDRMDALLKSRREASPAPLAKMNSTDAAKMILSSAFLDISDVGFDEVEAERLGLKRGARISVRPDDTGKDVPTFGMLVAMNREEIVLETEEHEGGPASVRVHFPKLGYVFQDEGAHSSKL